MRQIVGQHIFAGIVEVCLNLGPRLSAISSVVKVVKRYRRMA
jgi:hypothetical protein